jgi:hypothetical protein
MKFGLLTDKKRFLFNRLIPNGSLWAAFVKQQPKEKIEELKQTTMIPQQLNQQNNVTSPTALFKRNYYIIRTLGSRLTELKEEIDENLKNKNLEIIFDTKSADNWPGIFDQIGKVTNNENEFSNFISSLYMIMIESTSSEVYDSRAKGMRQIGASRYPPEFNRKNGKAPDCFFRITALRHRWAKAHNIFVAHWEPQKFSHADAQEHYLGHRNIPKTNNSDWFELQRGILEDFIRFLELLLRWSEEQ